MDLDEARKVIADVVNRLRPAGGADHHSVLAAERDPAGLVEADASAFEQAVRLIARDEVLANAVITDGEIGWRS